VETTFIDGEVFFNRQQDLANRQRLEQERKQLELVDANKAPAEGGTPPRPPREKRTAYTHDDDVWDGGEHER
jgi:hypothetical protein